MELLCEPLCEWCTFTSKLEKITQTLLLASVCVINKIVFEDLDLHGYFAWFLSCKKSLSVISFHIFTKPHPHPLHRLASLGSGRDPPAADGFTVRQRDSDRVFLKRRKGNRERQNSNKQDCVCIQKLVILCLSMCPSKGLNTADIKA